jgi:tetratricopeptide (TPR) repeat protein
MASSHFNYGNLYFLRKDYQKAKAEYEKCLEIRKRELGAKHLDVARCTQNIGNTYFELKIYKDAKKYYEIAKSIMEEILGPDAKDTQDMIQSIKRCDNRIESMTREEGEDEVSEIKPLIIETEIFIRADMNQAQAKPIIIRPGTNPGSNVFKKLIIENP